MKKLCTTLLVLVPLLSLFARQKPDLGLYRVRVIQADKTVIAELKPVKKVKELSSELSYYWCISNQIRVTQGGYSGRLLNGAYTEFFPNKNLKMQGYFIKGLKNGVWKSWDDSGKLLQVETWRKGFKHGQYKVYDDSGSVKESGYFYKNLLHKNRRLFAASRQVGVFNYYKGELMPEKFSIWKAAFFQKKSEIPKSSISKQADSNANQAKLISPVKTVMQAKLNASALYIVIIIALVIALLCSSMIVVAYFYKLHYQQKSRYSMLQNNLESGISLLLAADSTSYLKGDTLSLFKNESDSVYLKILPWGVYDIGVVKAFSNGDALLKSFTIGHTVDSLHWSALYLADEVRPLFVGGNTHIKGAAYLPKAGVQEVYVEGRPYKGDKRLIIGARRTSKSTLPKLRPKRLTYLELRRTDFRLIDSTLKGLKNIDNSYHKETLRYYFKNKSVTLKNIRLKGNIHLYSDNQVIIDSSAMLDNVIITARSIKVKRGFSGRCQLFASDSLVTGSNCHFTYPSCIGVLDFKKDDNIQPRISLGDRSSFSGILLAFQKHKSDGKTLIDIGEDAFIEGQVFSQGMIRFKEHAQISGNISASKFLYEYNRTMYENYLIDLDLDSERLSPYYLSSSLFETTSNKRKVLQWLDLK